MDKAIPPRLVDQAEGADILLDKPILLLGRHHECDIQLNSRKVSRRHCCIAQVNDHLVIRDLHSTNGIRINGEKVDEGKIKPGDELTVGNFTFSIFWEGHPEQKIEPKADNPSPRLAILEALADADPNVSCEHPIAIPEPPEKQKVEQKVEQKEDEPAGENDAPAVEDNAPAVEEVEQESKSPSSHMEDQPPSIILPENLDLAASDEFPRVV